MSAPDSTHRERLFIGLVQELAAFATANGVAVNAFDTDSIRPATAVE